MLTLLLACADPAEVPKVAGLPAPAPCAPWSLTEMQRFTQQDLYGDVELEDLGRAHGPGGALGDLDGDGWLDLLFVVSAGRSFGFRNDGRGTLVPDEAIRIEGEVEPGPLPIAQSVALTDLDGDGDLDGALGREVGLPDLVLTNDGTGVFTAVALPDSEGESLSPVFGDLNGDGLHDLFIGGFVHEVDFDIVAAGGVQGDGSRLYFQEAPSGDAPDEPAAWTDATARIPPVQIPALNHHTAVVDIDGDHDLDLFLANEAALGNVADALLLNDGAGSFSIAEGCFCDEPIAGMGAAVGDPNRDGLPDLYVTNVGDNRLYINAGDVSFRESAEALRALPEHPDSLVSWGAAFVDLDGDGYEDLPVSCGPPDPEDPAQPAPLYEPDILLIGGPDGFEDRSEELPDTGVGRTVLVGDLDRDGRPDLVVVGRVYVVVYWGAGGCGPGVTLQLDAGGGNRSGIGAKVEVTPDDGSEPFTRWMLPSVTYGSSAPEMYLGLGTTQQASVRVTWPDGSRSEAQTVRVGEQVTIGR